MSSHSFLKIWSEAQPPLPFQQKGGDAHYDHVIYHPGRCIFFAVSPWSLSPCYKEQEPLGEKFKNSINKSKGSMNFLKVHQYTQSLFTVWFSKFKTLFSKDNRQHLDSPSPPPPCCFYKYNSKSTKFLVLKFCNRYWPSLRPRYFWVPNRRGGSGVEIRIFYIVGRESKQEVCSGR